MAVGDDRRVDFIAAEHFERLALGVVIDAGEPRANERLSAAHASTSQRRVRTSTKSPAAGTGALPCILFAPNRLGREHRSLRPRQ